MKKNSNKICQICEKELPDKDLFPIGLIRSTVLNLASKKHNGLNNGGFVCYPDLRKINTAYFSELIKKGKGELSGLEKEVLHSLEQHELFSENINKEYEENLSFGERIADKVSRFGGSWTFIILFLLIIVIWICVNSFIFFQRPFDPYPFILLNLALSSLAAVQAPIILMSQNRQAVKDRLSIENDYQVNLKAELLVRQINTRLELFMKYQWQKMQEMALLQEEILQNIEEKK